MPESLEMDLFRGHEARGRFVTVHNDYRSGSVFNDMGTRHAEGLNRCATPVFHTRLLEPGGRAARSALEASVFGDPGMRPDFHPAGEERFFAAGIIRCADPARLSDGLHRAGKWK
jgi:hypothetical protein